MIRAAPWCLGGAVLATSLAAAAQPCGRPDLIAAFPDDGAAGVPLDAALSAVYTETADYLGEPVVLRGPEGDAEIPASFDPAEHRLSVAPAPLLPDTEYRVVWPELRGVSTAAQGIGREVAFTTGAESDRGPPEFDGVTRLRWDIHHVDDECTDDLEARFRFELRLGAASDDAADALALLVFQTEGPRLDAGPKLVALRPFPSERRVSLDLDVGSTTGRICFAAVARDLVGGVSASGHLERCVETTAPPFFYGCGVARGRPERAGALALGFLALFLGSLARRRRA